MSYIWLVLYNLFVIPLIHLGFWIGSLFNAKIREGLRARKKQFTFLRTAIEKGAGRRRILFHCTSAGEWLQALPIIEKMKALNPDLYIMVSFFSPSGYKFSKNPPEVDLKFYLPLDSLPSAIKLFNILNPELWIISKFDIWPNHVMVASQKKIPIVVTSATLSEDSGRDKGVSKGFNRLVYNRISHIYPISADDMRRYMVMVPDRNKYTIAGDTRYDHVYNRGIKAGEAGDIPIFRENDGLTLIAGSTWPADEKHILPAICRLCKQFTDLRVIVVPHELHENHLRDIETVFEQAEVKTERFTTFSGSQRASANVVIFNTIGLLARLYKQTGIAYIGGSFGKGIHNVMEPAVFGQPVFFGPNYLNSHEAGELLKIEAAYSINNEQEFFDKASQLISDTDLREEMGEKAKNLIISNIGATDIIIDSLNKHYDLFS